jgi:hypothetical protein
MTYADGLIHGAGGALALVASLGATAVGVIVWAARKMLGD